MLTGSYLQYFVDLPFLLPKGQVIICIIWNKKVTPAKTSVVRSISYGKWLF